MYWTKWNLLTDIKYLQGRRIVLGVVGIGALCSALGITQLMLVYQVQVC